MASFINDSCSESENEVNFNLNNDYANRYDNWREKEEFQKLKDRYGNTPEIESSSSSSSDDEEELTAMVDKPFLKTLSLLKSKDPSIYDKEKVFFNKTEESQEEATNTKIKNTKKEKPMFLKDYERKIILEKNGVLSDESDMEHDNQNNEPSSISYHEEQRQIKESLKQVLNSEDEDDDMLKARIKTNEEKNLEEEDYLMWLKGEVLNSNDKDAEKELKPLKEYWTDPKLEDGEVFLRDYILNKQYMQKSDNDMPTYDEIVADDDLSNDEEILEQQEDFEHKFNFRFEEPDPDFIKCYPRTMNNTLRRKDDKRKQARDVYKDRKKAEKEKKKEELKRFKALKRKEILAKIEKLKEITGNDKLGVDEMDLEGDFDPKDYDNKMQKMFNEEYYGEETENEKPVFQYDDEIDGDGVDEDWDNWQGNDNVDEQEDINGELHCEDADFNMDADYNPKKRLEKELIAASSKSSKKKKSKFAEVVTRKKPVFDPIERTFEDYLDEYYKLDFEDIVGDMPVRFPYREVLPNDFGLSVDEIMTARDQELNKWCSLKKTCQFRTEEDEKYDIQAYFKKGNDLQLKKRILQSLYVEDSEEEKQEDTEKEKSKRKRKRKAKNQVKVEDKINSPPSTNVEIKREKAKKKKKKSEIKDPVVKIDSLIEGPSKEIKLVKSTPEKLTEIPTKIESVNEIKADSKRKRKNRRKKAKNAPVQENKVEPVRNKKAKKTLKKKEETQPYNLSDERLKAYGLNPKKLKNKIKYTS